MSVTLNRTSSLEPIETTELTTTNPTTVHAASDKFIRVVEAISLANVDAANACVVKLEWVDSAAAAHVFWNKEVPAKDTVVIDSLPILTAAGGKVRSIRATAANAGDIHVSVISSAQSRQPPGGG